MSLHSSLGLNGYYDENGQWQRTKFCFAYCGDRCDCGPPGRLHYSAAHDKRNPKPANGDAPVSAMDILQPSSADDSGYRQSCRADERRMLGRPALPGDAEVLGRENTENREDSGG